MNEKLTMFRGTVEDVLDPLKMGRVRVRVDGYHTQYDAKSEMYGIPVEDLDWYPVSMPVTSSSSAGIGRSPTGLRNGDRVWGFFTDIYYQSGIVAGSLYGKADVANLAVGSIEGLEDDDNSHQIENRSQAPTIDLSDKEDMGEDDNISNSDLENMIIVDEGVVYNVYYDQFNYPHIGIGHLLKREVGYPKHLAWDIVDQHLGKKTNHVKISHEDVMKLFRIDLAKIKREIPKFSLLNQVYNSLNEARKCAIINMCFQMGTGGVAKFKNSLKLMQEEKWEEASRNLLKSKWASQTSGRANKIAKIIRYGNMSSYGKVAPKGTPKPPKPDDPPKSEFLPPEDLTSEFLPSSQTGDEINFPEMQTALGKSLRDLMKLANITTMEDVIKTSDEILGVSQTIKDIKEICNKLKSKASSTEDIKMTDFMRRMLDSMSKILDKIIKNLKKFLESAIESVKREVEMMVKGIELVVKQIKYNINATISDINNLILYMNDDMEAPPNENNTGKLFEEPPSEYMGEYPYNNTITTESGHVFEHDDTPNFERIKVKHKSGTYNEISADGRKVERIVGSNYEIVDEDNYVHIKGNKKTVIEGNSIVNILGDVTLVINGNVIQFVRGDAFSVIDGKSNATIHGDMNLQTDGKTNINLVNDVTLNALKDSHVTVKGNSNTIIEGNHDMLVKGDLTQTVEGNRNDVVKGNLTQKVEGNRKDEVSSNWDRSTSGRTNDTAKGIFSVNGSRIQFDRS